MRALLAKHCPKHRKIAKLNAEPINPTGGSKNELDEKQNTG